MRFLYKPQKIKCSCKRSCFDYAGEIICQSGCSSGGKAFKFLAANPNIPIIIKPGVNRQCCCKERSCKVSKYTTNLILNLNIQVGLMSNQISQSTDSIELHRWNQEPNTSLSGRTFFKKIPHTGGIIEVPVDSSYQWISIFARNINQGGSYDGVCFKVNKNIVSLISF